MKTKNIILSAFKKYGRYHRNSGELVAGELDQTSLSGFVVRQEIFPCTIPLLGENRGLHLFERARTFNASAIVCLGMASGKKGMCIETTAVNAIDNEKYCPELSGQPVDSRFAHKRVLNLDLRQWHLDDLLIGREKTESPLIKVSTNPGGFCCNHLIWQLRAAQLEDIECASIPFIFIHIPCSPECVGGNMEFRRQKKATLKVPQIIQGLETILKIATL